MNCINNTNATAKSPQSCPTLWDPIDGSPPGSPVPGILQARTLEWVTISFSNAWKGKVKVKSLSCVRLPATPWTAAYQAPPSMGFSRQEYWSGVPLPSPKINYTSIKKNVFKVLLAKRLAPMWSLNRWRDQLESEWAEDYSELSVFSLNYIWKSSSLSY